MPQQDSIAVIGAGIVGASLACALAREGRRVILIDRAEPGTGGASFGNAGHMAVELIEPLPSPGLLFGFWRMLTAFGGPLHIPARRLTKFIPWALRFGVAAFRREANTRHLAPIVRPGVEALEQMLRDIGRLDLLRQNGHYEIWLDERSQDKAQAHALTMERIGVPTAPAPAHLLEAAKHAARASKAAGLWFPKTAHVIDPFEVVRAFVTAAQERGANILRKQVRTLRTRGDDIEIVTDAEPLIVGQAVVCAGAWSATLLRPFNLRAPLEAARGYHIEIPGQSALIDAPVLYSNQNIVVTPMTGRLRATSFMEFAGTDAPPDPRKPAHLREMLRKLGYPGEPSSTSWVGPRPVLPDYLPAIGRVPHVPNLCYSFGHQHIGLTLAAVTAGLAADLIAGRQPREDISAFDLRRFGSL
jgi:D-hydroxyproline dehydrogenase